MRDVRSVPGRRVLRSARESWLVWVNYVDNSCSTLLYMVTLCCAGESACLCSRWFVFTSQSRQVEQEWKETQQELVWPQGHGTQALLECRGQWLQLLWVSIKRNPCALHCIEIAFFKPSVYSSGPLSCSVLLQHQASTHVHQAGNKNCWFRCKGSMMLVSFLLGQCRFISYNLKWLDL